MDSIERAARKLADGNKKPRPQGSAPQPKVNEQVPAVARQSEQPRLETVPPLSLRGPSPHIGGSGGSVELDSDRLSRVGFISPKHPVTRVAEEFRVLKRRILNAAVAPDASGQAPPRLIMITSTQPREGKTFNAVNLALSIATERDTHVLLVDGDFAHPSVFKLLDVKRPELGFLDVLHETDLGIGDVVLRTNIDHLSLIDAGRPSPLSTEYLASQRMQDVCRELVERYQDRIIIFDSSPMLATSEPSILSHHVGQVLYVVEARRTSRRAVQSGLELVHDQSKVMMILNRSKSLIGSEPFGGYYKNYRFGKSK